MRIITLEEHFAPQAYLEGPAKEMKADSQNPESPFYGIPEKLSDLGEKRIAAMDDAGIDMQVLSLTSPGTEQLGAAEAMAYAEESNNVIALAAQQYPQRFAGFAAIPSIEPKSAVKELERAVKSLGLKGAVINGHVQGRYLDDPHFLPILECAAALKVPVYLHPTKPPEAVTSTYYSGFSPMVNDLFARSGYGWHIETGVHVIRLILGGVFDRFPELQFIIGHLGETLPYMLQRMNAVFSKDKTGLQRNLQDYLKENIHYTISGFNYAHPFQTLVNEIGIDRIMFSADYPYAPMDKAHQFLEQLPLSESEKHQIAHTNAERLLGIA